MLLNSLLVILAKALCCLILVGLAAIVATFIICAIIVLIKALIETFKPKKEVDFSKLTTFVGVDLAKPDSEKEEQ